VISNIEKTNIEDVLNNIVGKVSYDFRDLLIKLLQKDPEKRISIEEMKKHSFFDGIVWEDIPKRKNPPPLK
jgi:serine/threonine protein kinase